MVQKIYIKITKKNWTEWQVRDQNGNKRGKVAKKSCFIHVWIFPALSAPILHPRIFPTLHVY